MSVCKFCLEQSDTLVSICDCKGSMEFVHVSCMNKWLVTSKTHNCPICKFEFEYVSEFDLCIYWVISSIINIYKNITDLLFVLCVKYHTNNHLQIR